MAILTSITVNDTGFIKLPSGTVNQRTVGLSTGYMRYNSDLSVNEMYTGSQWVDPTTGAASVIRNGLVLHLDAGSPVSYPGTGGVWYDLSGNGYDFFINSSAYSTTGTPHMNFEGSYGAAKRVVNNALSDVPSASNGTIMVFTSILNSSATWRTLTRGAVNDHQVLIQTATVNLGTYDNDTQVFIDSTFDVSSLPNPYTQFNCLTFRLSQSSPYYQFQYNADATVYSITNAAASFDNGFSVIGAYHNFSTNINENNQYWGKVAVFLYYNRHLTSSEISYNYNALKGRFGL